MLSYDSIHKVAFFIMIYICTHTDFNEVKTGDNYSIISSKPLTGNYSVPVILADNTLKPLEHAYSEGYMLYQIWTYGNSYPFIGLNHYRRYFDIEKEENTIPKPFNFNMHKQYADCHNIEDLIQVEKIIDEIFPEYHLDYENINVLYPCNMFILDKIAFNRYCYFLFTVLQEFDKKNLLFTDEDVRNYVAKRKDKYKQFNLDYQSRLQGFLMERISTIFFLNYFKDKPVAFKEIIVTSNKKL